MLGNSDARKKRATANTYRWREKHRSRWLAYAREYNRKWRAANPDKMRDYALRQRKKRVNRKG